MASLVVGYDGSDRGDAALDAALDLAGPLGAEIVVVFGYAPPGIWGGEIAEHKEAIEELGAGVVAKAKEHAAKRGVEIETKLVAEKASEALIDVAEERGATMIVVGTYGETPLKGAILGSTSYKLLHLSEIPVLVVPAPSG
jgi:nucleotide-binding universal stress UspA family protein